MRSKHAVAFSRNLIRDNLSCSGKFPLHVATQLFTTASQYGGNADPQVCANFPNPYKAACLACTSGSSQHWSIRGIILGKRGAIFMPSCSIRSSKMYNETLRFVEVLSGFED
eukprot:TRINITY_DN14574_c0_g1_i1.p1 TRINITY_DN14574_c0_g1~~TRINITY_DN14574_c0_g1_i1.p1  ORF type:complete len:112 (-),score=5.21 TRINITY_DN14574_c0_g1_i1:43-378(-)